MKVSIGLDDCLKIELDKHIETEALEKLLNQAVLPDKKEIKLTEEEWGTLEALREKVAFRLLMMREEEERRKQ